MKKLIFSLQILLFATFIYAKMKYRKLKLHKESKSIKKIEKNIKKKRKFFGGFWTYLIGTIIVIPIIIFLILVLIGSLQ